MAKKRAIRRRWVREVKTDSTAPPPGTFNRPAAEIARTMARKDVSPKGTGSGVRMLQRRAAGRKTGSRKTTRGAKARLG